MALMERVATLLRANVHELVERAEDPEKMLQQFVLDIENQLLQLKTQVAIALADQHLLERKTQEQEQVVAAWHCEAELAVIKGNDLLARAALERALDQEKTLEALRAQAADGTVEAAALRVTYSKLQGKLAETQTRCELLIAQHRRARMVSRATKTEALVGGGAKHRSRSRAVKRLHAVTGETEAQDEAAAALPSADSLERLARMENDHRVEQLLSDLKSKQQRLLPTG